MLKPTDYFEYFRQKAIRHKDIRHNPASETGNGPIGEKRFARISYEDFLGGLMTSCSFPALMIEQFEIVVSGHPEVPEERYSGAFTVLDTADQESNKEIALAGDKTLGIVADILKDMFNDHLGPDAHPCASLFEDIDIDMNLMPVGPVLDSQFGWRCTFYFKMRKGLDITTPPAPGTFIDP